MFKLSRTRLISAKPVTMRNDLIRIYLKKKKKKENRNTFVSGISSCSAACYSHECVYMLKLAQECSHCADVNPGLRYSPWDDR